MGIDFYYVPGMTACQSVRVVAEAVGVNLNLKQSDGKNKQNFEIMKARFFKFMVSSQFEYLRFIVADEPDKNAADTGRQRFSLVAKVNTFYPQKPNRIRRFFCLTAELYAYT